MVIERSIINKKWKVTIVNFQNEYFKKKDVDKFERIRRSATGLAPEISC